MSQKKDTTKTKRDGQTRKTENVKKHKKHVFTNKTFSHQHFDANFCLTTHLDTNTNNLQKTTN